MCHFITATLPKTADINRARDVFARHKLRFEAIENSSVEEFISPNDHYILTTQGMCDCGTVLGSEFRSETCSPEALTKYQTAAIEKLRKKGWSQARINRWLTEAELTKEKEKRREELAHTQSLTLVSDWVEFITDLLTSNATNRLGLLLHWYKGPLAGRIQIKGKKNIPLDRMTADTLLQMEEDFIYEFVNSGVN